MLPCAARRAEWERCTRLEPDLIEVDAVAVVFGYIINNI